MEIVGKIKYIGIVVFASILLTACNSANQDKGNAVEQTAGIPQKGQHVANNLVCMVNNTYMSVPQLEVSFEGKTYYGCCKMCQERIPKEKEARIAVDPYSLKDVDKANAYIVLVGDKGEVAYFENEKNYNELMAKSNLNQNKRN